MFNRIGIKQWARQRLTGEHRWMAVLVTFLAGLLGAIEGGSGISVGGSTNSGVNVNLGDLSEGGGLQDPAAWMPVLAVVLVTVAVVLVLAILYSIFVGNVIHVGFNGWMLRYGRGENPSVGELFASFRIYKPAMTAMLLRDVLVFLWSLLFLIPGIVKSFAYSMAPYIVYENPNLTANQTLALSRKLTDGYKLELFVMELSFIGWYLLSGLTLGILGILYVNPYYQLSRAGAYEWLRNNALQTGRITWQELYGDTAWPGQGVQGEG